MIEWAEHQCTFCCKILENGTMCERCQKHPFHLHPHTSLFSPQGPIKALYDDFLDRGRGETLAALVMVGMKHFHLPTPDVIVPLLQPREMGIFLRKQHAFQLAKCLSKFLSCSVSLPSEKLRGKTVLGLCDWLDKEEVFYEKKERLKQFFPEKVWSLALIDCRGYLGSDI